MSETLSPTQIDSVFGETAPSAQPAPVAEQSRISSLDFIRGIAVMGILFANVISFGQPASAYIYPAAFLVPANDPQGWQWIAQFVLIDGKMRGLFTLLFGAGLYLFMERAWERGSTRGLQIWRLAMLLCFGLFHFYFIWFGDILAMYAIIGCVAVAFMHLQPGFQMRFGLFAYIFGAVMLGGAMTFPYLITDTSFGEVKGLADVRAEMLAGLDTTLANEARITELKEAGDYPGLIAERFSQQWWMPLFTPVFLFFETLPLMLMGMALYRFGFFSGEYDAGKMKLWGMTGVFGGGAATLALGLFVQSTGFTYNATNAAFIGWSVLPRLAMVMGMAALLVELSKSAIGWFGDRVRAAGRAAFTNYLGTSIVMMFVFQGWALGLFGDLNRPQLYLVAALTCAAMLAWSKPWLERFRYGPLEWLWRCLTYRKLFPLKR